METELVERARQGDRDAFDLLAVHAVRRLYRIAQAILHDSWLAEDATQEALERAWRDLPRLRDVRTFDAWMYRVLTRACADERRRLSHWVACSEKWTSESSEADSASDVADRDQVERGLRRLTDEQKTILVLSFYFGKSSDDLAEILGIPAGTAKSRLHYAVDALRAAIAADDRSAPQPDAVEGPVA